LLGVQPAAAAPAPPPMSNPTVGTRPTDDPMLSGSGSATFMLGVTPFSENHTTKKESEEYFLSAALDVSEGDHPLSLGAGSRDGFIHRRGSRDLLLHSAADAGAAAPNSEPGAMAPMLCSTCEEQPADRLWHEEARTLRVATCWRRWDVLEAPCQVPRERLLDYNLHSSNGSHGAGGAEEGGVDTQTLGQFLQSHCFNLRRQCANPKCKGTVLEHEQCFSHHGGRLSVRVHRLPAEATLPTDALYGWSVCRNLACRPGRASPKTALSLTTLGMSLGRFLESCFYNTTATSRVPGCPHSLHLHHERYIGYGGLVCSMTYQRCIVFGITPPLPQRLLPLPLPLARVPPPLPPAMPPAMPPRLALTGGESGAPTGASSATLAADAFGMASIAVAFAITCDSCAAEVARGVFAEIGRFGGGGEGTAAGGGTDGLPSSHLAQQSSEIERDRARSSEIDLPSSAAEMMSAAHVADARADAVVSELGNHERLCSMMRWADALPEVKLRFEDELSMGATFADFFSGAAPGCSPGSTQLRATILYPAPFAALRERFCEGGDAAFLQSLRQASVWNSGAGGVSRSTFLKTVDDRYLLKSVPKSEFWAFHERAPTYFQFVTNTPARIPSVLVKILAAVVVEYKTADGNRHTQHFLVQENLFYGRTVSRMFDLKGARRNRGAGADGEGEDGTVLDENLFRFNNGYPLLLSELAKQRLTRALWNDTLFLASINVMDYSLLVGMVQTSSASDAGAEGGAGGGSAIPIEYAGESWTLMVGVIDYCRQYTWREEAEWRIKNATVTKPQHYKRRFRESLHRYFMPSIEKYAD
jgi:hypothetical protein